MTNLRNEFAIRILRFLFDRSGQDLIEYALMASLVAVAAGAVLPPVTGEVSNIFSKITSLAVRASS